MKSYSIIRTLQYGEISNINLEGTILDLGGNKKSGYQELIGGAHTFTTVNYGDLHPAADLFFNAEEKFLLEDKSFDNVLAMNFLEHIFNYHNVFAETSRVLKSGGLFVSNTPFMHHIHGSPDDYHRYTESTYRKLAEQYDFQVVTIKPLGDGLFSLFYQTVGGWLYFDILKFFTKWICINLDRLLQIIPQYRKLAKNIPLGYFVILKKR